MMTRMDKPSQLANDKSDLSSLLARGVSSVVGYSTLGRSVLGSAYCASCVANAVSPESRNRKAMRKGGATAARSYPTERELRFSRKSAHDTTSGFSLSSALR